MKLSKQLILIKKVEKYYRSGMPLSRLFDSIADKEKSPKLKKIYSSISNDLANGTKISDTLEKHKVLDAFYVKLISIAEENGNIDLVINEITRYINKSINLRKKILETLQYPAVVILVFALIFSVFFCFFVPQLLAFIEGMGGEPPAFLSILNILRNGLIWTFISGILTIGAILYTFFKKETFSGYEEEIDDIEEFISKVVLKIPLVGRLNKLKNLYSFLFGMKISYTAGLPIVQASELSSGLISNDYMRNSIFEARETIQQGGTVSLYLEESKIFDSEIIELIEAGEETGNLEEFLEEGLTVINDEIDHILGVIVIMVKPMGIVFGLSFLISIFLIIGSILFSLMSKIGSVINEVFSQPLN